MSAASQTRFPIAPLARKIGRRIASAALVLLAAASLTFAAVHLAPGDPVTALLSGGTQTPSPETIAAARHEYGLDRPIGVQFGLYLERIASGDLGQSFSQHMRVAAVLRAQGPATLALMASSLVTAWLLAIASIVLPTGRRTTAFTRAIETVCAGLPQFWLAILLLWALGFELRIFPPAGNRGLQSLVLPTLSLAIPLAGFLARLMRDSFDLALHEPFVLTARARGTPDWIIRLSHAMRHALLPGISLSAWAMGALVGNAVVIETIFSRRGIGRELFIAVMTHDMPLVSGIILFIAATYIVAGIGADALYVVVDPRLKAVRS